jgi:hypothetical protein
VGLPAASKRRGGRPTFLGETAVLLLRLLEFAFVVLALVFLISQITLPAIKGTRLFPMFDARRRAALEKLTRAREEREVEEVEQEAQSVRESKGDNEHV